MPDVVTSIQYLSIVHKRDKTRITSILYNTTDPYTCILAYTLLTFLRLQLLNLTLTKKLVADDKSEQCFKQSSAVFTLLPESIDERLLPHPVNENIKMIHLVSVFCFVLSLNAIA